MTHDKRGCVAFNPRRAHINRSLSPIHKDKPTICSPGRQHQSAALGWEAQNQIPSPENPTHPTSVLSSDLPIFLQISYQEHCLKFSVYFRLFYFSLKNTHSLNTPPSECLIFLRSSHTESSFLFALKVIPFQQEAQAAATTKISIKEK